MKKIKFTVFNSDMEVSDVGMEITKSDEYRELSENNEIANSILAVMQDRTGFFPQR